MLPESVELSTEIEFQDYPTNTFYVDPVTRQIRGLGDGITAMRQAVEIILGTERYKYQIFSPNVGVESLCSLIGADYGFVTSELRRRIDEAFVPDNRILGTSDWTFEKTDSDTLAASFTVNTVFGDLETETTVKG